MPIYLKYNTASQEIPLGYFLDSTDGNTEETGLTIANTDIKLWKAGATTLANKNSGGATHISNGIYYAVLDATDTDTLGSMIVFCHVSGALASRTECVVLPAVIYDSIIAGTDYLQTDLTQILGSGVSTSTAQLGVNVVNFGGSAGTFASGRPEVNTSHIAGSAVSTSSAQIGVNVVNAGGTAWGSGAITSGAFAAGAITASAIAADAIGASELAADAVAEIADAVWDEALSGHLSAGSTGEALNAAGAAGDPWTTSLPGAYGAGSAGYIVGTNINAAISSLPSAAGIADAVWDEATSGHTTAGTTAKALTDTLADTNELQTDLTNGGRLDLLIDQIITDIGALNDVSTTDVATAVWNAATASYGTAGSYGALVETNLDAAVSTRSTVTTAQVNAEVVDALATDTYTELAAVPAANAPLSQKLNWLFLLARNKITQTATTQTIYADDGSTSVATSTVSDDSTTATRGEFA